MTTSTTHSAGRLAKIGLALIVPAMIATACSSSGNGSGSGGGTSPAAPAPSATGSPTTSAAAGGSVAPAASGTAIKVSGGHLTDGSGRTVYLWLADMNGKSTCAGQCATVWPPVTATGTPTAGAGASASMLTTIKRSDGSTQVAYAGHPLYYFEGDTASGNTNGQGSDGFGAKWWEVSGAGQSITTTSAGAGAPSSPASSAKSSSSAAGGGYGY